ncbi:hypothetical protein MSG28_007617 [Choristoneura fumiferana]|uniref:Uncharacterized protein n=1 Tax=Choristoneura fumiferana TaxID=7141 RepID=A0ACC0JYH2_CHOFU|nr:hypothetical protein MSG28_007617 [Choristoneura fumiferana]
MASTARCPSLRERDRYKKNTTSNYSNIAAKVLRKALKPEHRVEALRRDESHIRITPWANGKPAHEKD